MEQQYGIELQKLRTALFDSSLSIAERLLLAKSSAKISPNDTMYRYGIAQYLKVALSALRCIQEVLAFSGTTAPKRILDFASGYGRVARLLPNAFPNSEIFVSDIDEQALAFCENALGLKTLLSNKDLSNLHWDLRFDLIWCGSLFSHLPPKKILDTLRFCRDHLSPNGILIVTTFGKCVSDRLKAGMKDAYYLDDNDVEYLCQTFEEKGFAFRRYPKDENYGTTLVSQNAFLQMADDAGALRHIFFKPQGWDKHLDVYAFKALLAEAN